jgi:hypothetical protein
VVNILKAFDLELPVRIQRDQGVRPPETIGMYKSCPVLNGKWGVFYDKAGKKSGRGYYNARDPYQYGYKNSYRHGRLIISLGYNNKQSVSYFT